MTNFSCTYNYEAILIVCECMIRMKKYKEPIKRSIRMLTNKSKGGTIGICCSQCELVFENRELLDLHSYTHLPDAEPNVLQTSHEADTGNFILYILTLITL